MRTSLGRVRGLGSAKDGTAHWWAQRVSAVALVPLCLWFVVSFVGLAASEHAAVVAWLRSPVVAVLLILLIGTVFYHAWLGLQVVVEDYVHAEGLKLASLLLIKFTVVVLAAAAVFAVLRVALRG